MNAKPRSVLFVCTMNAVRSPMAVALLKSLAPDWRVELAGLQPATIDPFAAAALEEIGLTIADHRPSTLNEAAGHFDLVIALSTEAWRAAHALWPAVEYWPVPDPTVEEGNREQRLLAFRAARDDIARRLKTRFEREPA